MAMNTRTLRRLNVRLRLSPLEVRLTPAGRVDLVTRADPGTDVLTAGGASDIADTFYTGSSVAPTALARSVSGDGRFSVFISDAVNLASGQVDTNGEQDVFLYDRVLDVVTLVSHVAGQPAWAGGGRSHGTVISGDGRYVSFISAATDLVSGFIDGNGPGADIYLFDRLTGINTLVTRSITDPLKGGNGSSGSVDINSDGGAVVFISLSGDLATSQTPGPAGTVANAFIFDRATGFVTLVSHAPGNPAVGGSGRSYTPSVSDDGKVIVYPSEAWNLVSGYKANSGNQLFAYDRLSDTNTLVTHQAGSPTTAAKHGGKLGGMSSDGRYLVLGSGATDLVSGFVNNNGGLTTNVYCYDRQSNSSELISHAAGSSLTSSNDWSFVGSISADGRWIAFESLGTDLIPGFVNGGPAGTSNGYLRDRLTGTTTLVTHNATSPTTGGNGSSGAVLSADGRRIVTSSTATDLVSGFVPGVPTGSYEVFAFDRVSGARWVVTHVPGAPLQGGSGQHDAYVISANGACVAFGSESDDLLAPAADNNRHQDVFVRHLDTDALSVASARQGPLSASANGPSTDVSPTQGEGLLSVSADGRYVAYASDATNAAPGQVDTNGNVDVFLLDRKAGTTILVSRAAGTTATAGNSASTAPTISADGRYVAYWSFADNLVGGFVDGNGSAGTDVYLFDSVSGVTTLVSRQSGTTNTAGNARSGSVQYTMAESLLSVSDDGRFVTFASKATDLVAGFVDGNGPNGDDVYLFDRLSGMNALVSHVPAQPTKSGNYRSLNAKVSGNGQHVAFEAVATDLGNGGTVYLYDRLTGVNQIVDHAYTSPTAPSNGYGWSPYVSTDGRYVMFQSTATNLVNGFVGFTSQVYSWDRQTGVIELVSRSSGAANVGANDVVQFPVMSADGRTVVYESWATNLVAGFVDGNGGGFSTGFQDVYAFDGTTGMTKLVSRSVQGPNFGGNDWSWGTVVSGNGRVVAFLSQSSNLVPGFTDNGRTGSDLDAYLFDTDTGVVSLVSRTPGSTANGGNGYSQPLAANGDGSVVVFQSSADNLVSNDANGFWDYFSYSNSPAVQSVQVTNGTAQRSVVRSLTVTFDQLVTFAGDPAAAFTLTRVGSPGSVGLSASVATGATTVVTLTFSGPLTQSVSLIDGQYQLAIAANQVTGAGPLDGNGDGVGGDDYTFNFHRLFGDADGDRDVDVLDFGAFRAAFGATLNLAFDHDNDGDVDTLDFGQFRARFGASV